MAKQKGARKRNALGHDPLADLARHTFDDLFATEEAAPAAQPAAVPEAEKVVDETAVPATPAVHYSLCVQTTATLLAQIELNGYQVDASDTLAQLGGIYSFRIIKGSLYEQWKQQTPLDLVDAQQQKRPVRIAALPVDADGFGLLEFI